MKSKLIDEKVRHRLHRSSNHDAILRAHCGNSDSNYAWFRRFALAVNGCYPSNLRGSTRRPVWSASCRDGRGLSIHPWCSLTSSMRWAYNATDRKSFSRIRRRTVAFERVSVRRVDAIDLCDSPPCVDFPISDTSQRSLQRAVEECSSRFPNSWQLQVFVLAISHAMGP